MKPIKYSVAYIIYNENRSEFLIVKRPYDDEDLPGIWGLPAGSVRDDETFENAIIRSGKEKLGVGLQIVKFVGRGNIERDSFILHMEEYEVKIIDGEPTVPQSISDITQYQDWQWGVLTDLKPAADKGSLCSQIYLKNKN